MAIIPELIRVNDDTTLSFGNHEATQKQKMDDFIHGEDIFRVRTHNEITRVQKNGELLIEAVPGATIHNFDKDDEQSHVFFLLEGLCNTNVTVQLKSDTAYQITCGKNKLGSMISNLSGKISFSVDLAGDRTQKITIEEKR